MENVFNFTSQTLTLPLNITKGTLHYEIRRNKHDTAFEEDG